MIGGWKKRDVTHDAPLAFLVFSPDPRAILLKLALMLWVHLEKILERQLVNLRRTESLTVIDLVRVGVSVWTELPRRAAA